MLTLTACDVVESASCTQFHEINESEKRLIEHFKEARSNLFENRRYAYCHDIDSNYENNRECEFSYAGDDHSPNIIVYSVLYSKNQCAESKFEFLQRQLSRSSFDQLTRNWKTK